MKKNFLIVFALVLGLFVVTSVPTVHAAQDEDVSSCVTAEGRQGTRTSGGPCVEDVTGPPAPGEQVSGTACAPGTKFCALAPIPGLTDSKTATAVLDTESFGAFFNQLYIYLIGLAAILAIIQIIRAGIQIALNQDSVTKLMDSKGLIAQAISGLVLVLSPVLIFSIINPDILKLDLNLQPIDYTKSPDITGNSGTDEETGCEYGGLAGVLQTATCPSQSAAQEWLGSCTGLTAVVQISNNPSTGGGQRLALCNTTKKFLFIETVKGNFIDAINEIDPVVRSETNQNNGSEAMSFKSICKSVGRMTCISEDPFFRLTSDDCPIGLTGQIPTSSRGSGKCYEEQLTCVVAPTVSESLEKCEVNPDWTVFQ